MSQDSKRLAVEGDILTNLPIEIILHVLAFLPVEDAARTSVLSRRWRYIWRTNPNLVLDRPTLEKILRKPFTFKSLLSFVTTVDRILLIHEGDIHKFDFCCPTISSVIHNYIDIWIQCVTRKGVRELTIDNMPNDVPYLLPSHVFNCSTLTHLRISKCVVYPPISVTNFEKLETLCMERVYFKRCVNVIKAPRLIKFTMKHCPTRKQQVNLDSPLLEYLDLKFHNNNYPNMICFTKCKNVRVLKLEHREYRYSRYSPKNEDRLILVKLVSSLAPTLERLTLGPFFVEMLSGNTVPFSLNRLLHLTLRVDFLDSAGTKIALELIKSSPCLKSLHIFVVTCVHRPCIEDVLKYLIESVFLDELLNKLKKSACLDQQLKSLKDVVISRFNGSKVEALFVKLLLRESPSLTRMRIEYAKAWEERDTSSLDRELKCSTKASSMAKISVFGT